MPLFEIDSAGELVPFRRLRGGAELYEREIEELVWANPEEIVGETLFLVQKQPSLQQGGRPDIVALDRDARVVVIEVKREFDRSQLAQCREYAGWVRGLRVRPRDDQAPEGRPSLPCRAAVGTAQIRRRGSAHPAFNGSRMRLRCPRVHGRVHRLDHAEEVTPAGRGHLFLTTSR